MKLGVAGMIPADLRQVDAAVAARVREAGFTGVSCFFHDPVAATAPDLERLRTTLAAAGVCVAQVNARYECLVEPDEARRRAGVASLRAAVGVARALAGETLYVRPGSLNPAGPWLPHPDNHCPETIDRLVRSLREVAPAAEEAGVRLAIEGHVLSPLDSPVRVREVIDRVASPALGFNVDPVNFVGGLADAYHSMGLLDRLFDTLGDVTWAAHVKDFVVEDRLVLHIDETVPGRGRLDLAHFFRRFEAVAPHGWALIEHLPDDRIPEARDACLAAAARAGIREKLSADDADGRR
jgi:sugar phosphate isomerase/epimerase